MADRNISELTQATTVQDADLFVLEQSGIAKKLQGDIFKQYNINAITPYVNEASGYADDAEASADRAESASLHPPYIGQNGNWWVFNTTTVQYEDSLVDASITVQVGTVTDGNTVSVTNSGTNTDVILDFVLRAGRGIQSVAKTGTSGLVDTYTVTYTDSTTSTFTVTNGEDGTDVQSIAKTGTVGLVDTYTMYDSNNHAIGTFNVTNGRDGQGSGDMLKSTYDSTNAVANAGGIVSYVDSNGGKIDTIKLNGVTQPIVNKTVDLTVSVDDEISIGSSTPTGNETLWVDTSGTGASIDATPTQGSYNAVSSGGVYTALSSKYDASNPNNYQTASQVTTAINNAIGVAIGGSY